MPTLQSLDGNFKLLLKIIQEPTQDCDLKGILQEKRQLYEKVGKLALEVLKNEKRDQDKCLAQESNLFFAKHKEYALSIYSYYLCYKCQQPYFGGKKRCDDQLQFEEQVNFQELICPQCSSNQEKCPKHGSDYSFYKCKYCCSVAEYVCWGSTHFCKSCHQRQNNGDFLQNYPKEKLPHCAGKKKCPLKMDHNPNGEEFCLGCLLCRPEI